MRTARQSRFFYGWVIVGISVVSLVLIYGIRHSFSVFFPPILEEFGWSRGSTAVMYSMNILVYGLLGPVAGGLADRWNPARVIPLGIAILALATASCAFATELWHFYLLFGVLMPVGTAFCGWPVLGPSLANWFSKKRGLAIGLGQAGGGLSFVYAMVAESAISQVGWRYAYFVLAGMLLIFLLPLSRLFHYRPEGRGLKETYNLIVPTDVKPGKYKVGLVVIIEVGRRLRLPYCANPAVRKANGVIDLGTVTIAPAGD